MIRRSTSVASAALTLAVLAASPQALAEGEAQAGSQAAPATLTAVIDAGSSGSRIYLYEGRATRSSVTVSTQFEAEPDTVPGLSSFRRHPARAGVQGIGPLLGLLTEHLTQAGIDPATVPTHVLATAGMRNVHREAPRAVRRIYASVRAAIAAAGLPVGRVGTISGRSEGLYSWTDVNYLRGVFGGHVAVKGIVEVGGASAQVAFVTKKQGRNVATVRIAGKRYRVFSVSFLGLGQNDARRDILQPAAARLGSPCYPNNRAGERPARYRLENDVAVRASASTYRLAECSAASARTITRVSENQYNARRSGGMTMPDIQDMAGFRGTRFIGLASIAHALGDFGVEGGHEARRLARSLRRTCGGPNAWPKVLTRFGGEISPFAENACANATYNRSFVLTRSGLDIKPSKLATATEIASESLSWTRGFAVLQTAR